MSKAKFPFDPEHAAEILGLIACPTRMEILRRLMEKEYDVSTLAHDLQISQTNISQHLTKLKGASLVSSRRQGTQIFYRSESPIVTRILKVFDAHK